MYDVIVIGAGVAGLTSALQLGRQGLSVLILEANEMPGGNVRTLRQDGFCLETGPSSFMGSSESIWRLAEKLDLTEAAEPVSAASSSRYILRDGRLLPLPMGLVSFVRTPLLSLRAKLRLAMEPLIAGGAREEDTAWDFFCRRFGIEAATYIMSPFVSGIYAGDVRMLGARAAFPKFWRFERESGSMILGAINYLRAKRKRLAREGRKPRRGLFSFRGGLGRLTERLGVELRDSLRLGVRVRAVAAAAGGLRVRAEVGEWEGRSVVVAVPPQEAAALMEGCAPRAADLLRSVPMAPVTVVHWSAADGEKLPSGFGFLVPRLCGLRTLGTIFSSQLFTDRTPQGIPLLSSFCAGMADPEAMKLTDQELADLVVKEHRLIFGIPVDGARLLRVLCYPHAIPQLLPDHPERIAALTADLHRLPGLFLAGNYLTGVGMEHAVESGFSAASQAAYFLATKPGEKSRLREGAR